MMEEKKVGYAELTYKKFGPMNVFELCLAGMARPGDSPAEIRRNIATAKAYVAEVNLQWRQEREAEELAGEVKRCETSLENARKALMEEHIVLTRAEAEKDRMAKVIEAGKVDVENPGSESMKKLVKELRESERSVMYFQDRFKDAQTVLGKCEARLAKLTGKEPPKVEAWDMPGGAMGEPGFKGD